MSRQRKAQPESTDTGAQAVAYQETLSDAMVAPLAPTKLPAGPKFYNVGVRNRCPWSTIQAASSRWSRTPIQIPADDVRLPELRRNEWLLIEPVED